MSCNVTDKKAIIKIAAVAVAIAAAVAGAAIFVTGFLKKRRKEECYIECDCSDKITDNATIPDEDENTDAL